MPELLQAIPPEQSGVVLLDISPSQNQTTILGH